MSANGGILIYRVRLQDEEDNPSASFGKVDDDLLQYYQFLAEKGDPQAQVFIAL